MSSINEFFVVTVSQGETWHKHEARGNFTISFSRESFGIAAESQ
jgi:hypothetical protein